MRNYILNGENMTTREAAHAELAHALELPDYYGANLDALSDVLAGMRGEIRMQNTSAMLNALEVYGCMLLRVLYEAEIPFIAD